VRDRLDLGALSRRRRHAGAGRGQQRVATGRGYPVMRFPDRADPVAMIANS
jgi:hypothetical protein